MRLQIKQPHAVSRWLPLLALALLTGCVSSPLPPPSPNEIEQTAAMANQLELENQPSPASDVDPKTLFVKSMCAGCHGKNGRAQTPAAKRMRVKDLSQSTLTDEEIIRWIQGGGSGKRKRSIMPSYQDKLRLDQIQSLLPLIKSFRQRAQLAPTPVVHQSSKISN